MRALTGFEETGGWVRPSLQKFAHSPRFVALLGGQFVNELLRSKIKGATSYINALDSDGADKTFAMF